MPYTASNRRNRSLMTLPRWGQKVLLLAIIPVPLANNKNVNWLNLADIKKGICSIEAKLVKSRNSRFTIKVRMCKRSAAINWRRVQVSLSTSREITLSAWDAIKLQPHQTPRRTAKFNKRGPTKSSAARENPVFFVQYSLYFFNVQRSAAQRSAARRPVGPYLQTNEMGGRCWPIRGWARLSIRPVDLTMICVRNTNMIFLWALKIAK